MADQFGFAKLADDYLKNVYSPLAKAHPNLKKGEAKEFEGLFNQYYVVLQGLKPPRFNQMLIELNIALKATRKLVSHKLAKRTPVEKGLKNLIPKIRKSIQLVTKAEKADDAQGRKNKLVECDISFSGTDFYNRQLGRGTVILTVDSKPGRVKLKETLQRGAVRFRGIMMEPSGKVNIELHMRRKVKPVMKQNLTYKGMVSGKTLLIDAAEEPIILEPTATSGAKAVQSKSVKGTLGVDFTVVKGGSELTTAKSVEESSSMAVKYKIFLPKGTLKVKQAR